MSIRTRLSTKTLWRINISLGILAAILVFGIWTLRKSKAEHLIPSNALAVLKFSDSTSFVSQLPFFIDGRAFVESIVANLPLAKQSAFYQSKIQLSLHKESKSDLGFLVYFTQNPSETKELKDLLLKEQNTQLKYFEQAYEGTVIHQVSDLNGDYLYGIIDKKEHLIISKSNLLLELYIDEQAKPSPSKFSWQLRGEEHYKSLQFNSGNLRQVADLFPKELSKNFLSFLKQSMPLNPEFLFEEKDSAASAYLIGKRTKSDAFFNIYLDQNGASFEDLNLVPSSSSLVLEMRLAKPKVYFDNYRSFQKKVNPGYNNIADSLSVFLEYDKTKLQEHVNGQLVYLEMEGQNDLKPRKILLVGSKSAILFEDMLKEVASKSRKLRVAKSPFRFAFGEKNIYDLNVPDFPKYAFNEMFAGFEEVLFTRREDFIIFSNDRLELINYLVQLDEKKTLRHVSTDTLAVLRAHVSPNKTWKQIYNSVPLEWQQKLLRHEASYRGMSRISLSLESGKSLARVYIVKNKQLKDFSGQAWSQKEALPIKAKSFLDLDTERLLYLSEDRKIGVIDKADRRISFEKFSGIRSFKEFRFYDFLQNGRTEVLILDNKNIFLLSLNLSDQLAERAIIKNKVEIASFDVNEKGIYFIDVLGNLFFYDRSTFKTIQIPLKNPPDSPIELVITEKQDVSKALILAENGSLYQYFISSGVSVKGFPKKLVTNKPAAMVYENNLGDEKVKILTEQGVFKTYNISQQIAEGEDRQLERGRGFIEFEIIWNQKKTDWLMVRRSKDDILILEKSGRPILQVEQPYGVPIEFSWFYDSDDNKFLCIFDGQKNQIYNLKGEPIGTNKIEAMGSPFLYPSMNELMLLNPTRNQLETWTIQSK